MSDVMLETYEFPEIGLGRRCIGRKGAHKHIFTKPDEYWLSAGGTGFGAAKSVAEARSLLYDKTLEDLETEMNNLADSLAKVTAARRLLQVRGIPGLKVFQV